VILRALDDPEDVLGGMLAIGVDCDDGGQLRKVNEDVIEPCLYGRPFAQVYGMMHDVDGRQTLQLLK
jgi:hypothetical protein